MSLEAAISQYQELMLSQYANLDKAKSTIGLLCRTALADLIPIEMQNAFAIDTALGDQLDVIGQYVGLSRRLPFEIDRFYFSFISYETPSANEAGFLDYNSTVNTGSSFNLYLYFNAAFNDVPDDIYRQLLKLKIILNASNGSLAEITNALYAIFQNKVKCFDDLSMNISYLITPDVVSIVKTANKANILPKPLAVDISAIMLDESGIDPWSLSYGSLSNYSSLVNGSVLNYLDRV